MISTYNRKTWKFVFSLGEYQSLPYTIHFGFGIFSNSFFSSIKCDMLNFISSSSRSSSEFQIATIITSVFFNSENCCICLNPFMMTSRQYFSSRRGLPYFSRIFFCLIRLGVPFLAHHVFYEYV